MSVRKLFVGPFILLVFAFLAVSLGCEAVREYDYYADAQKTGTSTSSPVVEADVARIMSQMRAANLHLVDALVTMNSSQIQQYSVEMFQLAKSLRQTQPAVALHGPTDVADYRKIADDLGEIIIQVGVAARDKRFDYADSAYTAAFPTCNRCHMKFRGAVNAEPVTIPEAQTPALAPVPPPAPEVAPLPAPTTPPVAPAPEPAPAPAPVPAPAPGL